MRFVGIRNSPEKARLLSGGSPRAVRVGAEDLAYDCIRHTDLLRRGEGDVRASLYWRYLVSVGHTDESADARCRRFLDLAATIRSEGFDPDRDPIAVSDDGMRLNGSHRAAIACSLGLVEVDVRMHSWGRGLLRLRARHVAEEARVKREAQEAFVGRQMPDGRGSVVFVDAEVPSRLRAVLGGRASPVLVVERRDGSLERLRPGSLTLR